jgi:hypothetical protein
MSDSVVYAIEKALAAYDESDEVKRYGPSYAGAAFYVAEALGLDPAAHAEATELDHLHERDGWRSLTERSTKCR